MTPVKTYRVVVIEWLSHQTIIEAASAAQAEAKVRKLWAEKDECDVFSFEDSGVDGITVEEVTP
jgi:hypothetical protein